MSTTNSTKTVLDATVVANLAVTLWSGRRRLRKEDLAVSADQLPPDDLASLGSLKLCEPDLLTKMASVKRAAERELLRFSSRFLGGFAMHEDRASEALEILERRRQEFLTLKQQFLADFSQELDEWVTKHPKWEQVIRKVVPERAHVDSRLQFGFQIYRVGHPTDSPADPMNKGLEAAQDDLASQVLREINQDADETWRASFEQRDKVSQKALRPLRAIREKLVALSYLHTKLERTVAHMDTVLDQLPKAGWLEGRDFAAAEGLLLTLSSSQRLRGIIESTAPAANVPTTQAEEAKPSMSESDADEPTSQADVESKEARPAQEHQAPLLDEEDEVDEGPQQGHAPKATPVKRPSEDSLPSAGNWF